MIHYMRLMRKVKKEEYDLSKIPAKELLFYSFPKTKINRAKELIDIWGIVTSNDYISKLITGSTAISMKKYGIDEVFINGLLSIGKRLNYLITKRNKKVKKEN